MNSGDYLAIWTVYNSPADYPGLFVARKFLIVEGNSCPTVTVLTAPSLDGLREQLPHGLTWMPRYEQDHPCIVECWL